MKFINQEKTIILEHTRGGKMLFKYLMKMGEKQNNLRVNKQNNYSGFEIAEMEEWINDLLNRTVRTSLVITNDNFLSSSNEYKTRNITTVKAEIPNMAGLTMDIYKKDKGLNHYKIPKNVEITGVKLDDMPKWHDLNTLDLNYSQF